jgi:hypothetical protein
MDSKVVVEQNQIVSSTVDWGPPLVFFWVYQFTVLLAAEEGFAVEVKPVDVETLTSDSPPRSRNGWTSKSLSRKPNTL